MATNFLSGYTIPTLDKCCCLQLQTAGIIISFLCLIPVSCAMIELSFRVLPFTLAIRRRRMEELFELTEEVENIENWHDPIMVEFAFVESILLVLLCSCILQTYGAIKGKRTLMIPFMTLLGYAVNVIIFSEAFRILFWSTSVPLFLTSVALGSIGVFTMLILFSYYRQLQHKPPSTKEGVWLEAIEGAL